MRLPHNLTAADFSTDETPEQGADEPKIASDWAHCFFSGFDSVTYDGVLLRLQAEAEVMLEDAFGLVVDAGATVESLCRQLKPDDQLTIWKRALGISEEALVS